MSGSRSFTTGGGGGGTPIQIFFQVVGVEDIKAAISQIQSEFGKVDAAAAKTGQSLGQIGTNMKTAGSAASSLTPVSTNLNTIQKSADSTSTSAQNLGKSVQATGQSASSAGTAFGGASGNIEKFSTSTQSAGDSATTLAKGADTAGGSIGTLADSANTAGTGLSTISDNATTAGESVTTLSDNTTTAGESITSLGDATTTTGDSLATTSDNATTAGDSLTTVGDAATSTNDSMTGLADSTTSTSDANSNLADSASTAADAQENQAGAAQSVETGMGKIQEATKGTVVSTNTLKSSFEQATTTLEKGEGQASKTSSSVSKLKGAFESNIAPMSAVVAAGVTLFHNFENISRAQVSLDLSEKKLISTHQQVERAQTALDEAVAKFGPHSNEAAEAQGNLEKAQIADSVATEKNSFAQSNMNETLISFAQEIIPSTLSLVANLAQAYDGTIGKLTTWSAAQKAASTETTVFGGVMKALGIEFQATGRAATLLSLTPLLIGITAVTIAVTAFVTNMGGFRDMINGIGTWLGNALPPLKGFLNILGGFGGFLVKTLGGAKDEQTAYAANTNTTMQDAGKAYEALKQSASKSLEDLGKFLTANQQQLAESQKKLDELKTSLSSPVTQQQQGPPKPPGLGKQPELVQSSNLGDFYKKALENAKAFTVENGKVVVSQQAVSNALQQAGTSTKYLEGATKSTIAAILQHAKETDKLSASGIQVIGTNGKLATSIQSVSEADKKAALAAEQEHQARLKADAQKAISAAANIILQGSIDKSNSTIAVNNAILGSSTLMQQAWTAGTLKATAAMKENEVNLIENAAGQAEYSKQLDTSEGQVLAFGEGALKMATDLNKTKAAAFENAGALALLNTAMSSGKPQIEAYNAAFTAQELVARKNELAISSLQGTNAALFAQLVSGETAVTSFNTGMEKQKGILFENAAKMFETAGAVEQMKADYETGLPTLIAYGTGLIEQDKHLQDLKLSTDQLRGTNDELTAQINDQTILNAQYSKGLEDQRATLLNLITDTAHATGVNAQYAAQLNDGSMQTAKFAEGQTEAEKTMLDLMAATSKTDGEISQYISNLQSGEEEAAQFASGQTKMNLEIVKTVGEITNLQGQFLSLAPLLTSTAATNMNLVHGFEEGRLKMGQFIETMQNANGVFQGNRAVLIELSKNFGLVGDSTLKTNKNMEDFIGVMEKSPAAIDALINKITEFADSAATTMGEAMKKGGDEVTKAIEKIQADLGRALTAPEIRTLKIEADTKNAVNSIKADIGLAFAGIKQGASDTMAAGMDAAIKVANDHLASASAPLKSTWQAVLTSLQAIKADPFNKEVLISNIAQIVSSLDTLGVRGQGAIDFLNSINAPSDVAAAALLKVGQGAQATGEAAATADPQIQALTSTISDLSFVSGVIQEVFETGIPQAISGAAPALSAAANTYMQAGFSKITQVLLLLGPAANQAVVQVNTAFGQMGVNIPTITNTMLTNFTASMNSIVNIANAIIPIQIPATFTRMATTVALQYGRMSTDATNGFNSIVNLAISIIPRIVAPFVKAISDIVTQVQSLPTKVTSSFNAVATAANTAASKVASPFIAAFNQVVSSASSMGSRVSSIMSSISSSANSATSSVKNLANAINSLKNKTVTITTVYRTVYQTTYAAGGFGPAIVDHPMNLTVGESGREFVSVIPIKSSGDRNLSPIQQLYNSADPGNVGSNSTIRAAGGFYIDDEGNVYGGSSSQRTHKSFSSKHRKRFGPNPRFIQDSFDDSTTGGVGGGMGNISYQNAEAYPGGGPAVQNTITLGNKIYSRLDSFTGGVSKFLATANNTLNQITRTNTTGITSIGGGTTYADYGSNVVSTGHGGFIKMGDATGFHSSSMFNFGGGSNISNRRDTNFRGGSRVSNISNIGTGGGGSAGTGDITQMISHIAAQVIDTITNKMSLSINNQNIIDGKKIYESQQTHFGLKNGTLLK